MIDAIGAIASVLLPWVAGTYAVRALWRREPAVPGLVAIGYGYFVGALGATWLMRALSLAGIRWSLPTLAAAMLALGAIAWWLARRPAPPERAQAGLRQALAAEPPLLRWLFWLALSLIAIRLAGLAVDVVVAPLRGYDQWAHWATKARVWFEHGRMVPFVSPDTWLARGDPSLFIDASPGHPGTTPLLQAWTANFLAAWNESLINLPWIALSVALPAAFFAQARLAGAGVALAMVAAWLLMTLPILDAHIASAGAADVFMAATYGLAAMAAWRWSVTREAPMAWLALVMAVAGVLVKVEGVLWMSTLVPGVVVALSRRAGFALAGAAAVAFAGYLAFGPARLPLMGYVLLSRPVNVLPAVIDHVFVFDNWHLAAYALVALVAWRWRRLLSPRLAPMTMTMAAAVGLVVVVYFFTSAAGGVADETLVNRFLLHLAPALAFYALLLYVGGGERRGDQPSLNATNAADA
ncbi:MAG: hypothetical protein IPG84_12355 [Betaproteobacteria bacterium]|nr:hypothetical protein [Betaproteobacteria bacterium]